MLEKIFERSVAFILLCTAVFKILAAFGPERLLGQANGLLPFFTYRTLILCAVACEVAVALLICIANNQVVKIRSIFSLSWMFFGYQVALWYFQVNEPCKCLGNLGSWMHLSNSTVVSLTRIILAYMLLGSSYFLFRRTSRLNSCASVQPASS